MKLSAGILSRFEDINRSPLNLSKSKNIYSFPRERRFHQPYNITTNSDFYNMSSLGTGPAASFGYGAKWGFDVNIQDKASMPSPQQYMIKSCIGGQRGKSFSHGPEVTKQNNNNNQQRLLGDVQARQRPGPGTYKTNNSTFSNISYSMRPRTKNITPKLNVPGPGQYEIKDMKADSAKKTNLPCLTDNNRNTYMPQARLSVPGPGQYDLKTEDNLSHHQTRKGHYFPQSHRTSVFEAPKDMPGPGKYQLHSEFGYYGKPQNSPRIKTDV